MTDTKPVAMRDALLTRIHAAMQSDARIFFLTADFGSPVLDRIRADYPERFANVGIAEQNLINVAAGLALEGHVVFAYAIAPFITMRCYEQIRVSLALLSQVRAVNVNLIGVGAGYSYVVSGPTHQCYEDLTLMRALPVIQIYSPADHMTAAALCEPCIAHTGPKYLRLDAQLLPAVYVETTPDIRAGFHTHRRGGPVCLVATGYMLHTALQVADELALRQEPVGVIDLFDLTGFDTARFAKALSGYAGVVSLEEGFSGRGGLDALLAGLLGRHARGTPLLGLGVDGGYRFELGTRTQLHEQAGIGPQAVLAKITGFIQSLRNPTMEESYEIPADA